MMSQCKNYFSNYELLVYILQLAQGGYIQVVYYWTQTIRVYGGILPTLYYLMICFYSHCKIGTSITGQMDKP